MSEQIDLETIVVAVDGSDHAQRAVRWAAEQASLERRGLVVLMVSGALTIAVVWRASSAVAVVPEAAET